MKKRRKFDPDMPIGKLVEVEDFLPPPSELVFPERTEKITISLSKASIMFFKRQAAKHHTKYQKMIRKVLDKYAAAHEAR